jgi:hypothetical protein
MRIRTVWCVSACRNRVLLLVWEKGAGSNSVFVEHPFSQVLEFQDPVGGTASCDLTATPALPVNESSKYKGIYRAPYFR